MYITEHISFEEVCHSNTAMANNIYNIPGTLQLGNIQLLAAKIFEPLRLYVNGKIKVNSFYRSPELNTFIGGSRNSQHIALNGAAMDLDDTYGIKTNKQMFSYIMGYLDYDQLIWEQGGKWIHVSFRYGQNRKQVIYA